MIHYLSDAEGRWDKLADATRGGPILDQRLSLDGDHLRVGPDARFVYGGDTVDRGPEALRLLRTLVEAADALPDRVVLLAGNRDINKLRLPRELGPFPRPDLPDPLPARLDATLRRTMGAGEAWGHRVTELGPVGADPDAVVQSFLSDVLPDGPLFRYLRRARLAYRQDETLFVHGAVLDESYGHVPGEPRGCDDVDTWIAALNDFYQGCLSAFEADPLGEGHLPLVAYQAPLPGTRAHQQSVVYGRPATAIGSPKLPSLALRRRLMDQGVRRLVLGHTPMGDCPAVLRDDGFEQIIADTSYAPLESGLRVRIDGRRTEIGGRARTDAGDLSFEIRLHLDHPSRIGALDEDGSHVRALLEDGREILARFLPGWVVQQRVRG